MIVDCSDWPAPARNELVDWVFNHPHRYTLEDIEWMQEKLGIDEPACRAMFKEAPVLGAIMADGVPLYIFSVSANGHASTASEERLESFRWYMTKELIKFRRSDLGRKMLSGSIGFADEVDLRNGSVRHRWLEAIGYAPYSTYDFVGQRFVVYHFKGG